MAVPRQPTEPIVTDISEADFICTIQTIRVVGSVANGAAADVEYHWRFYLIVATDRDIQSIVFDMIPAPITTPLPPINRPGQLWVLPSNQVTSKAVRKVEFEASAVPGVTVGVFFFAYLNSGLDHFTFAAGGRGCLWHSLRVLKVMEAGGVAVPGSAESFLGWLRSRGPDDLRIMLALANTATGTYQA